MAVQEVQENRLSDVDIYWPMVLAWFDENWACSPVRLLPDPEWLKTIAPHANFGVAFQRTGSDANGAVVYRTDGRVMWLLAIPAQFVAVAEELCAHVQTQTGVVPWGVVENSTPLQAFLTGNFTVTDAHPQYPQGQVIEYVGVA